MCVVLTSYFSLHIYHYGLWRRKNASIRIEHEDVSVHNTMIPKRSSRASQKDPASESCTESYLEPQHGTYGTSKICTIKKNSLSKKLIKESLRDALICSNKNFHKKLNSSAIEKNTLNSFESNTLRLLVQTI